MPPKVRTQPIEEMLISQFDTGKVSFLWEKFKVPFEFLFQKPKCNDDDDLKSQAVCTYKYGDPQEDWSWYIFKRLLRSKLQDEYKYEKEFFEQILNPDGNRLIFLSGHVGVGKSTFVNYFFKNYLPYIVYLPKEELEHFIPVKLALRFDSVDSIESEWDLRVLDFLYERFSELYTENFIKNLGRSILYKSKEFDLKLSPDGILTPADGWNPEYVKATEKKIADSFISLAIPDVINWIKQISPQLDGTLGSSFNCYIIKLLAKYYNYKFFFIVDNIDQLHPEVQDKICRIVHRKMDSYIGIGNINFIIVVRENMFEPVRSQSYPTAYEYHKKIVSLPELPFYDVLMSRKKAFFDPARTALNLPDRLVIELPEGDKIEIANIDNFIERLFYEFRNTESITNLYKIANMNNRIMLDIIKSILRSPHMEKKEMILIARTGARVKEGTENEMREFISRFRIIDSVIRGTNHLVAIKSESYFPNIFLSASRPHFASTLTRLFILRIISVDNSIYLNKLMDLMLAFGHPKECIEDAINDLLEIFIIYSNRGSRIEQKMEFREIQKIEKGDLPFCDYFLDEIVPCLRYFQAMAYVTPMEKDIKNMVPIPEQIKDGVELYYNRVKAASALYKQVVSDMWKQNDFLLKQRGGVKVKQLFEYFGFNEMIDYFRYNLIKDIHDIGNTEKRFIIPDNIVYELFPK